MGDSDMNIHTIIHPTTDEQNLSTDTTTIKEPSSSKIEGTKERDSGKKDSIQSETTDPDITGQTPPSSTDASKPKLPPPTDSIDNQEDIDQTGGPGGTQGVTDLDDSQGVDENYGFQLTQDQLDALNSYVEFAKAEVQRMAESGELSPAETETLMNLLKHIGGALATAQEQLYEMQLQDSQRQSNQQQWFREQSVDARERLIKKMDDARNLMEQIAKKAAKVAPLAKAMKVLGPTSLAIGIIITIASAGAMGPLVVAMSIALTAITIVDQNATKGMITKWSIGLLGTALSSLGTDESSKQGLKALGDVITIVLMVAIMKQTAGATRLGVAMMGSQAATSLQPVKSFAMSCGADEGIAQAIDMSVSLVAMLVAGGMMSKGIGTGKSETEMARTIANKIGEVNTQLADRTISTLRRIILMIQKQLLLMAEVTLRTRGVNLLHALDTQLKVGSNTIKICNGVVQKAVMDMRAALEELEGKIQAQKTTTDASLEMQKADLQELIKGLQDILRALASAGQVRTKMYKSAESNWNALRG